MRSRSRSWLVGLSLLLLGACAPAAGPAPRIDLQRVAAEVVATAAARPSPAAEPKVASEATAAAPEASPTPSAVPASTEAPPAAAPTATPPPSLPATATPRPASAAPLPVAGAPTAGPHGGVLGPGGTFARFGFDYPGDRSVYTVNVHVDPDDAGVLKNAGFLVYGPGGEEIVRGGAQPGRRPNVSADVIHTRPGRYLVLVHNYDPAKAITYQVQLVPGPPPGR